MNRPVPTGRPRGDAHRTGPGRTRGPTVMLRLRIRRLGASVAGLLGATALGFWLGQGGPLPGAFAQPPAAPAPPANPAEPADYSQRVVAYIYGTVPITR